MKAYFIPVDRKIWENDTTQPPHIEYWGEHFHLCSIDKDASLMGHVEFWMVGGSELGAVQTYDRVGNSKWRWSAGDIIMCISFAYNGDTIGAYRVSAHPVVLDKSGNVLWERDYGNALYEGAAIKVSDDGAWVVWLGIEGTYPDIVMRLRVVKRDQSQEWYWTPAKYPCDLAISSDADRIVLAEDDGLIEVYDRTGTLQWSYNTGDFVSYFADVSLDGLWYVALNQKEEYLYPSELYFFDKDGNKKWQLDVDNYGWRPVLSPDGMYVVFRGSTTLYVYDRDGNWVWEDSINGPPEWFTFTSNYRVVGMDSSHLWVWDIAGNLLETIDLVNVSSCAIERDYGEYAYIANGIAGAKKAYLYRLYQAAYP
jgi:hypothetical protein